MPKPLLLLVDDSKEMGLIVSCLGKRAGCEVVVCFDAESAWESLSRWRPDLVLLDVNLPGASGPDWLRRVRAAAGFAGLPVALYTHWGLPADVAAGLDAGADFVFDKDLAARPTAWIQRLTEIQALASNVREAENVADAWPTANASPRIEIGSDDNRLSMAQIAGLNKALRHPSLRCMAPIVMRAVLRRALTRMFTPRILPRDLETWIALDGSGLDPARLPLSLHPNTFFYLSICLAEQMGRLLGAEADFAFRDALTAAVPGLPEFLAGS
jgi:CheY-like chemotaxis protein